MEHNSSDNLKDTIFSKIETEGVTPQSRLRFMARDTFFALASIVAVVVGAIAISTILYTSLNAGWEYYEMTHANILTFTMQVLPYLWIIAVSVTVGVGYYNLRHTKRGYRYPFSLVVVGLMGGSILGGVVLYNYGMGEVVDYSMHALMPDQYQTAMDVQKEMWHDPDSGRYLGVVASTSPGRFWLKDMDGELWEIDVMALKPFDTELLELENEIRLIGVPAEPGTLVTGCVVLPGVKEITARLNLLNERRTQIRNQIAAHVVREEETERSSEVQSANEACRRTIGHLVRSLVE